MKDNLKEEERDKDSEAMCDKISLHEKAMVASFIILLTDRMNKEGKMPESIKADVLKLAHNSFCAGFRAGVVTALTVAAIEE